MQFLMWADMTKIYKYLGSQGKLNKSQQVYRQVSYILTISICFLKAVAKRYLVV